MMAVKVNYYRKKITEMRKYSVNILNIYYILF